jgi:hypothetical protein
VAEVGWRRSGMDGESRLVDTEVELCLWYRDLVNKRRLARNQCLGMKNTEPRIVWASTQKGADRGPGDTR